MPYSLSPELLNTKEVSLVLAFGRLSVLEACSVLGRDLGKIESPSERIAVLHLDRPSRDSMTDLAGIHKAVAMVAVANDSTGLQALVDRLAGLAEDKQNLSVSGYDLSEDQYEDIVRSVLDGLKEAGLKKVRLLRSKGNELTGEEVVDRSAADVVAFQYHGEVGLGLTGWVPDTVSMRLRGVKRPVPRPDISLSPRLARVLVNLAGLRQGETLLDPFCGSGAILAEGFMKHYHCLGLDTRASRVQDARENLGWVGGGARNVRYDIRKGDARELPRMLRGTKVDAVVTEPLLLPSLDARPKTSTASQMIQESGEVYSDSLASMAKVVRPGGRIVIVAPVIQTMEGEEVSLTLEGRKLGLKPYQPGPVGFEYPVRLSFESTRWVKRAVYVFESLS